MKIKLSMITICWNAASTLRRTLDSVLAQTRRPDEYVFIDGGSTDGTLAILDEYREKFLQVGVSVVIENQRRVEGEAGIPNAWNQALKLVTGDAIAMLNADDWYAPSMLAEAEAAFEADDDLEAAIASTEFIDGGKCVKVFHPESLWHLSWKMPWPHPGCVFRKRLYDKLGLYDTRYKISADYDFVWRCSKANIRWKALVNARVFMELGGLANTSRQTARRETLAIACRHAACCNFIPWIAYWIRSISER